MKGSVHLGSVFNIAIKVHWTFLLIFVWVVIVELRKGGNLDSILFNAAFVLVIFLCVVLHELGHALMAKRFGVRTRKITLLPIGGVASLEKIPEAPYQEFLVAIAGPLVNVAIALILLPVVPLSELTTQDQAQLTASLSTLSFNNFLLYLFVANLALVGFNLIPAFPMDGGRVLRAILAMYTGRVNATRIAAGIGQFLAVVFLLLGLFVNIFLVFIALFVFIGAYGENKMVQHTSLLRGHQVREAMLTSITYLQPQDTMEKVIGIILSGTEKDFVVVEDGEVLGVLTHNSIMKHTGSRDTEVSRLMETDFRTLRQDAPLEKVLSSMQEGQTRFIPVTDEKGQVVGAIDSGNLNEFIMLQSHLDF